MTVQWFVPPHEAERITAALHALMVAARSEPGYVRCQLSTDMGQRARLRYAEEWNGEADLQRQLRSTRFAQLAELIERAVERPLVEFELPSGTRGLDYVEEVRGRTVEPIAEEPI
jgi:quinol monooxygenase YgiN